MEATVRPSFGFRWRTLVLVAALLIALPVVWLLGVIVGFQLSVWL